MTLQDLDKTKKYELEHWLLEFVTKEDSIFGKIEDSWEIWFNDLGEEPLFFSDLPKKLQEAFLDNCKIKE